MLRGWSLEEPDNEQRVVYAQRLNPGENPVKGIGGISRVIGFEPVVRKGKGIMVTVPMTMQHFGDLGF